MFIDPISRRMLEHAGTDPERGPVILMYHGTPATRRPHSPWAIGAHTFRDHLTLLADCGWNTATVRDLGDAVPLSPRTVIPTFDDGCADNLPGAAEPLAASGQRGTFFIVSGIRGAPAPWYDGPEDERRLLDEAGLRALHDTGMEIGSHTVNHTDLQAADGDTVNREVHASRAALEDLLGAEVTSFAYPYGRHTPHAVDAVASAGYRHACIVRPGWVNRSTSPHLLRRVSVLRVFPRG